MQRRLAVLAFVAVLVLLPSIYLVEERDTYSPHLREVVVPVEGLQRELTLLQATDLQGWRFGARQSDLAELLKGRTFDAAVLTGDLQDAPRQPMEPAFELVDVLRAHARRVYYVRGNHDALDLGRRLAEHGCAELPTGAAVPLSGADPRGRDAAIVYGGTAASVSAAKGSGRKLLVIASHTPPNDVRLSAGKALGDGTHLYVAGHTHGGQVRLPLLGAVWAPMSWPVEQSGRQSGLELTLMPDLKGRLVKGMYERGGQSVFVSVGLGSTAFHHRFLCRSEMVLFRFVPQKSQREATRSRSSS